MARQIVVELIGDAKSLSKATKEAESFASRVKKAWSAPELKKGFLGGLGLGAGFGAANMVARGIGMVTDTIGDAIDAASDWGEATSKVSVVFEDQAGVIERWARSAATAMGMSGREALKAAGTFGNLFDGLGVGADTAVDMSQKVVQLAADLGSFNNVSTDEVLGALQSGLLGEAEPMRRFGVALSEAKVQAFGMANGLGEMVKSGKTYKFVMNDAQKVQARWGLILKDTKNAQGDYARTSDSLANSQKTLNAEVDDLRVELGKMLQGPAKSFVRFLTDVVTGIDNIKHALGDRSKELDTETEAVILLGHQYGIAAKEAMELASHVQNVWPKGMSDEEKARLRLESIQQKFRAVANDARVAGRGVREDFGGAVNTALAEVDESLTKLVEDWKTRPMDAFKSSAEQTKQWLYQHSGLIRKFWGDIPQEMRDAVLKTGAFMRPEFQQGPAFQLKRTTLMMSKTMAEFMEPWKSAWKQAAAWAKDPFKPHKFENWVQARVKEATRKAQKAAEEGKPEVARRWRAIARAMKSPVIAAVGEIKTSIAEVIAAMEIVAQVAKRTGTTQMGSKDKVAGRASGGPVRAGTPYIVGEHRPELFVPDTNGTIVPRVGGMGGGSTYNIHVSVAPGGDLVEAGRQMVRAITQYERRSGRVWRAA